MKRLEIVSFSFGLCMVAVAICFWTIIPRRENLWRLIPRERYFGSILGLICLAWSAWYTYPILEGGWAKLRAFLAPTAITVSVLSFFWLDYLLTRALGGFLLLLTNWLLHEAFVAHAPYRPLFAATCYGVGFLGMLFIAAPYRLRDILEKIHGQPRWRAACSCFCGLCGIVYLAVALKA